MDLTSILPLFRENAIKVKHEKFLLYSRERERGIKRCCQSFYLELGGVNNRYSIMEGEMEPTSIYKLVELEVGGGTKK